MVKNFLKPSSCSYKHKQMGDHDANHHYHHHPDTRTTDIGPPLEIVTQSIDNDLKISTSSNEEDPIINHPTQNDDSSRLPITSFSEVVDDVTLHFQIIRLQKQIYAWIGCNSAKFGHLYAAAATRPRNAVSVTSLIGGSSDNTGTGIARRLVLKTGLNVVLACNIPKNSPMLEAAAERRLVQKLVNLGYTTLCSKVSSSTECGGD